MNILIDNQTGENIASYNRPAIKTTLNARYFPKSGEFNNLPSRTIPDQTLSLRTLLDRHARGLPLSGNNLHPVYNGEDYMPDVRRLDISEIHDLKHMVREDIENQKLELSKAEQAKKDKKDKAAADKLAADLLNATSIKDDKSK